jgi:hypothetical protein
MARNAGVDDGLKQLAAAGARLRASTLELRVTLYATQHRRRTPNDIRAVMDHARRAVQRCRLIRRQLQERRRIH